MVVKPLSYYAPRHLSTRNAGCAVAVAKSKALAAKRPSSMSSRKLASRDLKAEDVNRVLDKISAQGLESLTNEERSILEEMSRRLRKQ